MIALAGLLFWYLRAHQLRAAGGPGLHLRHRPAARRRDARAHAARWQRELQQDRCRRHAGVQNVDRHQRLRLIGGGNKTNAATMFIPLKHWDERKRHAGRRRSPASIERARRSAMREGMAIAFNPPAIRGLGTAGGFEVLPAGARRPGSRSGWARCCRSFTQQLARRSAADRHQHVLPRRPCRSCASRSTARRRCRSACR